MLKLTDGRVGLMLELKIRGLAKPVTEIVQQSGFSGSVIYASFHHKELACVRESVPSATIMPLISRGRIAPSIPAKLSDAEFWKLVTDFSESNGYFRWTPACSATSICTPGCWSDRILQWRT